MKSQIWLVILGFKTRYTYCDDLMCCEHLRPLGVWSRIFLMKTYVCSDERATGCFPRHSLPSLLGSNSGLSISLEKVPEFITDTGLSVTKSCQYTKSPVPPEIRALETQEH